MCVGYYVPGAPHAALCAVIPSGPSKARAESDPVISVLPLISSLPIRAGTAAKYVNKVVRLPAKLKPLVIDHGPYCGSQRPFPTLIGGSPKLTGYRRVRHEADKLASVRPQLLDEGSEPISRQFVAQ